MARVKPAYKSDPAPKVVSSGSVRRPKKPAKWNPRTTAANATPHRVQAPL